MNLVLLPTIFWQQFRAYGRSYLKYRADFIVGNLGSLVQAIAGVAAYLFLFSTLGIVGGWTAAQWTLVLGLVTAARGLWSLLFVGTLDLGDLIRTGKFDSYVLRPVNSLFLLSTSKIGADLWGELGVGVFLIGYGLDKTSAGFSVASVGITVMAVAFGLIIFYAMFLLVQVASFWIPDNSMIFLLFERFNEYAKIPQSIYPAWLRVMFSSVFPIALVGYFPGSVILRKEGLPMLGVSAVVAITFLLGALWLWALGVRRYSSSG